MVFYICDYIHAKEYHSAVKRKNILTRAITWMSLGNMLSETNQTFKKPNTV